MPSKRNRPSRGLELAVIGAAVAVAVAVLAVAGCVEAPSSASAVPAIAYGTPIDAGPKPDAAACDDRLRAELGAAVAIRSSLLGSGLPTTEVAARVAAADPGADTAAIGVPLTQAELLALRQAGIGLDAESPISFWVSAGAPERFGGIWRTGQRLNVTVYHGDAATLALARCVEPPNTAYRWADVSLAEGTAVLNRISADMARLRASGLQINLADYDETTGVVNVGVAMPTPEALAALQAEYGPLVRLVQQGPISPA